MNNYGEHCKPSPDFLFHLGGNKLWVVTGKGCFLMAFPFHATANDRNKPSLDRQWHALLQVGWLHVSRQLWIPSQRPPAVANASVLHPPTFSLSFPCPWANKCVGTSLQGPVINVFMEQLSTGQAFDDFFKEINAFAFISALTCKHRRKGGGPHSAHLT